jgi:hypothetical protein
MSKSKMIEVDSLNSVQLNLIYHLAKGYSGFTYYSNIGCWKVEKQLEHSRLTSIGIIPDSDCKLHYHACMLTYERDLQYLLNEMRSENLVLSWTDNKHPMLYYAAFPEIIATDEFLHKALQKVVIKGVIGEGRGNDLITSDVLTDVNFDKLKQSKDKIIA